MSNTFKVGDRVRTTNRIDGIYGAVGELGTVKAIGVERYGVTWVVVEFDNYVQGGHNCDGMCANDRGLWVQHMDDLEPADARDFGVPTSFGEFARAQERFIAGLA